MCVVCFSTAQLAAVGAVSARWWYVNQWKKAPAPSSAPTEHEADEASRDPGRRPASTPVA